MVSTDWTAVAVIVAVWVGVRWLMRKGVGKVENIADRVSKKESKRNEV